MTARAGVILLALSIGSTTMASSASAVETTASGTVKKAPSNRSSSKGSSHPAASRAKRGTAVRKAPDAGPIKPTSSNYANRRDVLDYIDELVTREHFDRAALLRIFDDVRYNATAARLMLPGSTGVRRDWNVYRARFVEPVRLTAGFRFWEDHAALLERVEREFGVPAEIIVGILGVETVYGRNTGGFRVVDALTTLAFDYPRGPDNRGRDRSAFFREQLTDVLLMTRDSGADVAALKGSYAGAIGMPQFMPGSIRDYAIDYDGDGRIDLVGSVADVVGSVASFLVQHGWVRDMPTQFPLTGAAGLDAAQSAAIDAMVDAGSVPSFTYADLKAAGLTSTTTPVEPLALIDLPSGSDAQGRARIAYLAGTQNFHVITRYNRSYFYAFSVIELGATIKALREAR